MKWERDEIKNKYKLPVFWCAFQCSYFKTFDFSFPHSSFGRSIFFFVVLLSSWLFFADVYSPFGFNIPCMAPWNGAYVLKYFVFLFKRRKKRFKVFREASFSSHVYVRLCIMHMYAVMQYALQDLSLGLTLHAFRYHRDAIECLLFFEFCFFFAAAQPAPEQTNTRNSK